MCASLFNDGKMEEKCKVLVSDQSSQSAVPIKTNSTRWACPVSPPNYTATTLHNAFENDVRFLIQQHDGKDTVRSKVVGVRDKEASVSKMVTISTTILGIVSSHVHWSCERGTM